jgi:hypothetical protein
MPHSSDVFEDSYTGQVRRLSTLRVVGIIFVATVTILSLFFGGEYLQRLAAYRKARASDPDLMAVRLTDPIWRITLDTISEIPMPWRHEKLASSGLPVYDLRIAPKDLRTLQQTAEQVTARSIATGIPREYVPAQFLMDGEWLPIQVKLRGLYGSHYLKKRPSLRLKFPRTHLFDGKKQINLSQPYDKGLTVDVTTNWELEHYDILTWKSQFVVLRLNGEVVGLFQEIEQFGRSMADRSGRPEGFIFSGDGQLFGTEGTDYDKALAAIDLVKACRGPRDTPPAEHCSWEFFRTYFDTDKWAWAAALIAVLQSAHAWHPDNLRMFWDPARGSFEPIPWDYACYPLDPELHPDGEDTGHGYGRILNSIPEFRRMRDQRMWKLLTERVDAMIEHAAALFEELTEPLRYDTRHLSLELDKSRQASYGRVLDQNRQYLVKLFQEHDLRVLWWTTDSGDATFALENRGKSFLRVSAISITDGPRVHSHRLGEEVIVDGFWSGAPGTSQFQLSIPPGSEAVGLAVRNGVTGAMLTDQDITIARGEGAPPDIPSSDKAPPFELTLGNVDVDVATVRFGPGRVRLLYTVEIPASHHVVFAPGLELKMGPGASLVIYGDLTSNGTAAAPVTVSGADPQGSWGGVFVQGTRTQPSSVRIEHTVFHGGTGGQNDRTSFTGSFSVHDGVVVIRSSEFLDAAAEDGINLKYAEVDLRGNLFRGSKSDAVDLDFCTGVFIGNNIENVGGDGLDLSGSKMEILENTIAHCADKGFSVGEKSDAVLIRNTVSNCYTGVAVKDSSQAVIRGGRLAGLEVGISLYVKKPTFGPSRAELQAVEIEDVGTKFLRDAACSLEY